MVVKFVLSGQKNIENHHTHQFCISEIYSVTQCYLPMNLYWPFLVHLLHLAPGQLSGSQKVESSEYSATPDVFGIETAKPPKKNQTSIRYEKMKQNAISSRANKVTNIPSTDNVMCFYVDIGGW